MVDHVGDPVAFACGQHLWQLEDLKAELHALSSWFFVMSMRQGLSKHVHTNMRMKHNSSIQIISKFSKHVSRMYYIHVSCVMHGETRVSGELLGGHESGQSQSRDHRALAAHQWHLAAY